MSKNKLYALSNYLIGDRIYFKCKDNKFKVFKNSFNLKELLQLTKYFQPNHTIELIQLYVNGMIEKRRCSIYQGEEALSLNFYLINKDQISIPLLIEYGNNAVNDNNNIEEQINYLKNKLKEEKDKNQILMVKNKNLMEILDKMTQENKKLIILEEKIKSLELIISQQKEEIEKYKYQDEIQISNSIHQLNPGEKAITVNFVSMGNQDIGHYSLVCKNTDIFVRLEERLYKDFPILKDYENFFEVKTRRIKRFKTLDENNIKSNDLISIFINDI